MFYGFFAAKFRIFFEFSFLIFLSIEWLFSRTLVFGNTQKRVPKFLHVNFAGRSEATAPRRAVHIGRLRQLELLPAQLRLSLAAMSWQKKGPAWAGPTFFGVAFARRPATVQRLTRRLASPGPGGSSSFQRLRASCQPASFYLSRWNLASEQQ